LILIKNTGIHSNNNGIYSYNTPSDTTFNPLWNECNSFLISAKSSKRNLGELYEILKSKPYKLKKGFIEFWIPLFLIIKKEDYALFHETNGFVPFISDDVLDLIHKAPTNYSIKSYDVSGLNVNLLEGYKELVNVSDNEAGTKSTFLSIFGNFLRFYRGLNDYSISTKKLSDKTIKLREAIKTAKDPEDALFNQFPNALGFHSLSIKDDEEVLKNYTTHIQDAIRELRSCFDSFIDRIEITLLEALDCSNMSFEEYKKDISNKLISIDQNLLSPEQNVFFKRLFSPLDDRTSWIKSVADVALGKSIDKMIDEEEILLMNNLKEFVFGLIKAADIHAFNKVNKDKLVYFEFIDESGLTVPEKIIIDAENTKKYKKIKEELKSSICDLDENIRKQILFELLTSEIKSKIL
jgi:hypothetical protein